MEPSNLLTGVRGPIPLRFLFAESITPPQARTTPIPRLKADTQIVASLALALDIMTGVPI